MPLGLTHGSERYKGHTSKVYIKIRRLPHPTDCYQPPPNLDLVFFLLRVESNDEMLAYSCNITMEHLHLLCKNNENNFESFIANF